MNILKYLQRFAVLNTQTRQISTTTVCRVYPKLEEKCKWNTVVKEAERAVGYPTSFLSLRWILNDEIANVAIHIRKLLGTNHPLLKTAKNLLLRNEHPTWGLIVLLMSKVAGLNSKFSELECDRTADILHSQRIIAEVTEMIKTSNLIHKGLINIDTDSDESSDLNFGNKLALLCGDYLLSTSFHEVARLRNFQVQETISSTLRDLSESEFIGLRNKQNEPIPSKPLPTQKTITIPCQFGVDPFEMKDILGNMKAEWTLRNILAGGSLLGKCCQCALILANHDKHIQELGYSFGRNLALAWQAALERDLYRDEKISLISAPVMLHLQHDPNLYKEIEKEDVDYDCIKKIVGQGPGMEMTIDLQNEYSTAALDVLDSFSDSESKTALVNIVKSL